MATILIVEDDQVMQEALEELLQEEGHTVAAANNGQEALNILEHAGERIVLLNMMLPVVNGLQVIRWLEDHPQQAKGTKVIAMSAGWGGAQKFTRPVSSVVFAYLPKPFDLSELLALVTRAGA